VILELSWAISRNLGHTHTGEVFGSYKETKNWILGVTSPQLRSSQEKQITRKRAICGTDRWADAVAESEDARLESVHPGPEE